MKSVCKHQILCTIEMNGEKYNYCKKCHYTEKQEIGREIAGMSDEDFEANCKAISDMLSKSKGNNRKIKRKKAMENLTNGERNTERLIKLGLTKEQARKIKRKFASNFKAYGLVETYDEGTNLTFHFMEDFCAYLEKSNIKLKISDGKII